MNKIFYTVLLSICVYSTATAQFNKATLQASGLTCAMCAKSIYTNLTSLPFVKEVDTDLNASAFVIVFKDDADVDPDVLAKKVEDAGFSVASLKLTIARDLLKVRNDSHIKLGDKIYHFVNVKNETISAGSEMRIIDQHFVSGKEFKKFSVLSKMDCIKTGKAQQCCASEGVTVGARIFHMAM